MAITVTHKFVSAIPDGTDATIVRPSNWNDTHDLTGLGTMAEQDADAVAITGGTVSGVDITSPEINQILDTNGNEILGFSPTASATDFLTVKNGIGVGVPLHVYADGPSANIGLHIQPKGTGLVTISDGVDFNKGIRFRSSGSAASAITLLDAVATAGRVVTLPDATTTLVGRDTTDTLTNKRITPRVISITGAAGGTITPTGDTADQYNVTALGAPATFAIPSGTPTDGQKLIIRIEDDGTGRALTWTTSAGGYRALGFTLPTTTIASRVLYIGCIYNSQDVFWDVMTAVQQS